MPLDRLDDLGARRPSLSVRPDLGRAPLGRCGALVADFARFKRSVVAGVRGCSLPRLEPLRCRSAALGPYRTHVTHRIRRIAEARDLDDITSVRRMDELIASDVHALVAGDAIAIGMEEHEVPRLERPARDRSPLVDLRARVMRQ